uniref:FERM domain-containing protein n=1 Tax=Acrobeloides nanus TaxID=290746 RepID=A0A914DH31_9BILA
MIKHPQFTYTLGEGCNLFIHEQERRGAPDEKIPGSTILLGLTPTEAEAKLLEFASRLSTYDFDPYVVRDAKQNVEITISITYRGIMIYLQNSQIHYLQ